MNQVLFQPSLQSQFNTKHGQPLQISRYTTLTLYPTSFLLTSYPQSLNQHSKYYDYNLIPAGQLLLKSLLIRKFNQLLLTLLKTHFLQQWSPILRLTTIGLRNRRSKRNAIFDKTLKTRTLTILIPKARIQTPKTNQYNATTVASVATKLQIAS